MGTIAPHENNEVRLVLSGSKPLAAIEMDKDHSGYAMAINLANTGALAMEHFKGEVLITLPKNRTLLGEYLELLHFGVAEHGIKQYTRLMGRIFGYTEEDTEAFIAADIQCDCAKCTGV